MSQAPQNNPYRSPPEHHHEEQDNGTPSKESPSSNQMMDTDKAKEFGKNLEAIVYKSKTLEEEIRQDDSQAHISSLHIYGRRHVHTRFALHCLGLDLLTSTAQAGELHGCSLWSHWRVLHQDARGRQEIHGVSPLFIKVLHDEQHAKSDWQSGQNSNRSKRGGWTTFCKWNCSS